MSDRPQSKAGMDLLEFAAFVADHARGHECVCELHSDDLEELVKWAAKGLGVEPPKTPSQRLAQYFAQKVNP